MVTLVARSSPSYKKVPTRQPYAMDNTKSKCFMRNGIGKISRYVRAYAYLVLPSQVQARFNVVGNSASALDTQQVFNNTFNALIMQTILLEDFSTDRGFICVDMKTIFQIATQT